MKKRIMKILTALSVVAVVTVGGTLAYLHTVTETKTNVFSSNKNISIQLRELKWDGYDFEDEQPGDGLTPKPGITEEVKKNLGVIQASSYVPGQKIPKDPAVKNNGDQDSVDCWVAMKVQYFNDDKQEVSYSDFASAYLQESGIAFDSNWEEIMKPDGDSSKYDIYYYKEVLKKDGTPNVAEPLFSEVPLSWELEPVEKMEGDQKIEKLPTFQIVVKAYAVQSDGVDTEMAKAELYRLATQN